MSDAKERISEDHWSGEATRKVVLGKPAACGERERRSEGVRNVLSSDLGQRYAEGWPGERVYAGCRYIDQIELAAIDMAKRLFKAEFVDVRPVSGACANLAVYSTLTNPGDVMVALSIPNGGHISAGKKEFSGTAGLVHGLQIEYFSFDKDRMNIDVDESKKKLKGLKAEGRSPKIIMFGGSLILFPQPVKEMSEVAKEIGAVPCYDAAHVAGLIAGGQFQDPLREGAHLMSFSTHKTLFGPQGGVIVAREEYGEGIKKAVFPGTSSNHHLHHVAAKALTFAEFLKYGKSYAKDVVTNAYVLAESLAELGESVIGENMGYTKSHQVALDVTKYGDGGVVEKKLEDDEHNREQAAAARRPPGRQALHESGRSEARCVRAYEAGYEQERHERGRPHPPSGTDDR